MPGLLKVRISYLAYLLLCFAIIWMSTDLRILSFPFLGQMAALAGVLLFSFQFLLTSRVRFLDRLYGYPNIVSVHKLNAKLAFTLIVLHPALLYSFSLSNYLRAMKFHTIFEFMGVTALGLFLTVIITSVFRKKIKLSYESWKKIHLLVYLAITLGFVHGYFLGYHVSRTPYLFWYAAHIIMVMGVLVYRFYWVGRHALLEYKVIGVEEEAREIYTVFMRPLGDKLDHEAGQFTFVKFRSDHLPSEEHHFTISSQPSSDKLSFSIEAIGDYTKRIKDLKEGDIALLEGAFGDLVADGSGEYLFIAGGIGITPIMSIIREQFSLNQRSKIRLLYTGRSLEKMAFVDELRKLSDSKYFEVDFYTTESREKGAINGRITKEAVREIYGSMNNPSVYVVGPKPLIKMVESSLRSKTQVRKELFAFN